jgi:hypothetical protein
MAPGSGDKCAVSYFIFRQASFTTRMKQRSTRLRNAASKKAHADEHAFTITLCLVLNLYYSYYRYLIVGSLLLEDP